MSTTDAGVLAKPAILEALNKGEIFISNFDERQLNNCSYDIRLGETYFEEQPALGFTLLDPYHPKMVEYMWGQPQKPVKPTVSYPISRGMDRGIIVIPPKGYFLCHSEEFIGCVDTIKTTMIKARSTIGRLGLHICACAGWGDIGYAFRWTLEVRNNSQYRSIVLRPGMRIGQIVFMPTTGIEKEDMYTVKGKYQSGEVVGKTHEELDKDWDPYSMIPRMWDDWDAPDIVGTGPLEPVRPPATPRTMKTDPGPQGPQARLPKAGKPGVGPIPGAMPPGWPPHGGQ